MEKCVGDVKEEDFGMGWKRRLDKSSVDGERGRMWDFSEGGGQRRGVDALLAMLGLWRKGCLLIIIGVGGTTSMLLRSTSMDLLPRGTEIMLPVREKSSPSLEINITLFPAFVP
jgi:hypothetical protein